VPAATESCRQTNSLTRRGHRPEMSNPNNQRDNAAPTPVPMFHPVWCRDPRAWFPGNEAASLLLAGQQTWEDILRLSEIRSRCEDEYDQKLLLKCILVELRSLIEIMDALQAKVMSAETYEPGERPPYRGISTEERERARRLFSRYSEAKKRVEADLIAIRNKIGAHRDVEAWSLVMSLWDKMDPSLVRDLVNAIPPAFNYIKDLNVYDWGREPEPGVLEFLGGPVGPWLFENETPDVSEEGAALSDDQQTPPSRATPPEE